MKTAYQWFVVVAIIVILITQVVQWQINDTQIEINQKLIDRVIALDSVNARQWRWIEAVHCNPELIKCGK